MTTTATKNPFLYSYQDECIICCVALQLQTSYTSHDNKLFFDLLSFLLSVLWGFSALTCFVLKCFLSWCPTRLFISWNWWHPPCLTGEVSHQKWQCITEQSLRVKKHHKNNTLSHNKTMKKLTALHGQKWALVIEEVIGAERWENRLVFEKWLWEKATGPEQNIYIYYFPSEVLLIHCSLFL